MQGEREGKGEIERLREREGGRERERERGCRVVGWVTASTATFG